MNYKICTRCNKNKSTQEFYAKPSGKYGVASVCIQCCKEKRIISDLIKVAKFDDISKVCSQCCRDKWLSAFYINIAGIHGRHSVCIECTTANRRLRRQRDDYPALAKQRHIDYYAKNKQRVIERTRKYREDNPEKYKLWISEWESKNKEHRKKKSREWRNNNKSLCRSYTARRRAVLLKAIPSWSDEFDKFFIQEIYDLAAKRTELLGIDFAVDHIVPLNSEVVCGLHCSSNLQLLPASENSRKSNKHWPDMP